MIDTTALSRVLNNTVKYGTGFIASINTEKLLFNAKLAAAMVEILYGYIDSKSNLEPGSLGHMYEPGMLGQGAGRLFKFDTHVTTEGFVIEATFLESNAEPLSGGTPFRQRASIMEAGTPITIQPKDGGVLAFEIDGELIVTSASVTIDHPGGSEAVGAFAETVNGFFDSYLSRAVLDPIVQGLSMPIEFDTYFAEGTLTGQSAGVQAGRQYMNRSLNESI